MPGTFSQLLYHIVYSTKGREPYITPEIAERLHAYIGGIVREEGGTLLASGGMDDHVHHLIRTKTDTAISKLMQIVKGRSSVWVHDNFPAAPFAWQEGYAVFTVSKSNGAKVRAYIDNQAEHHRTRDFRAELLALLKAHDIEFEERYVFD